MLRFLLLAVLVVPEIAAAQSSNAARWLAEQELTEACAGNGGGFAPEGIIERDLTGDGRADLILSHEAVQCSNGGRSLGCGMQVCAVQLYVREGDLLTLKGTMLGGGVAVSGAQPPVISGYGHGGSRWSIRWTGDGFR